jgi:7,8-dihydropterin-6-yl-methyl-4-(beta-D-ribofuranosyl)aminobenzene 5'-phosphate synthase
MVKNVRITILVENLARGRHLLGEHGLSFYIEVGNHRILFDTGQGKAIRNNADVLGIDLAGVDTVVLSHGHYDHAGGFAALPAGASSRRVFLHPSAFETKFSRHPDGSVHDVGLSELTRAALQERKVELVWSREPTEAVENVLVTDEIPRHTVCEDVGGAFFTDRACTQPDLLADDQALAIRTPQGVVLLLGCAHSGVVNTIDCVARLLGEGQFHAVIGGMHLIGASHKRIKATLEALENHDVRLIGPCHCTGATATASLWQHFMDRCRECSAGTVLEFA